MTHQQIRSDKGSMLSILLVGILGGWLLATLAGPISHDENGEIKDSSSNYSTKLSDLPHGIFSLMDETDSELEDINSLDLAFIDDPSFGPQSFAINGFERFSVAANDEKRNEALALESLVFSLDDSDYHSLQLLRSHDTTTGEETFHMTFHNNDSTETMLHPARRLGHQHRRLGSSCDDCVKKLKLNRCKSCRDSVKNKAKEVDNLKSEVSKKSREISSLKSSVNDWKNKANQYSSKITDLEDTIDSMKDTATGYTNKITDLEDTIDSMKETANGYTNKIASLEDSVASLEDSVQSWKTKANDNLDKITSLKKTVEEMENTAIGYANQIDTLQHAATWWEDQATGFANDIVHLHNQLKDVQYTLDDTVQTVADKTVSLATKLEDKVVAPIKTKIKSAKEDLKDLDDLAETVADSTVNVIKKLNFLPETGEELAEQLGKAFMDFVSQEFCVPYECIANSLLGQNISDIEIYSTDKVSISTSPEPSTCLQVTDIGFDASKLEQFLDLFKDLDALEDIFNEVKKFLVDQMNQIVKFSDDVVQLLDRIYGIANDAAKNLDLDSVKSLGRRKLVSAETEEPVSTEEVSAIAYEKGVQRFHELYGEHVARVFKERKLAQNGGAYIGLKSLVLNLTADFSQTFTLEAKNRTGYAGSVFDESVHQTAVIPVPFTGGMMKLVGSGSMEASMPYAMAMEAAAHAEFKYNVGEMAVSIDVVSGEVTNNKAPFSTEFNVNASAGVSGTMSLNFAASTSMGLCLGPSEDACITITIDASQTSAAGFDALAGLNLQANPLTTMYTDELEYEDVKGCDDQLSVSAGYWQYVKEPSVKVSITATDSCSEKNDVLFNREGKVAQKTIDHFCLSADVPDVPGIPI